MTIATLLFALTAVTGAGESTTLSRHDTAQSCIEARIEASAHKVSGVELWCKYERQTPLQQTYGTVVSLQEYKRLIKLNIGE